jgi:hypothetical protein
LPQIHSKFESLHHASATKELVYDSYIPLSVIPETVYVSTSIAGGEDEMTG